VKERRLNAFEEQLIQEAAEVRSKGG